LETVAAGIPLNWAAGLSPDGDADVECSFLKVANRLCGSRVILATVAAVVLGPGA
jgi:hypothetical protein